MNCELVLERCFRCNNMMSKIPLSKKELSIRAKLNKTVNLDNYKLRCLNCYPLTQLHKV